MAFNPFDYFSLRRRSTKIILATLGIACMFLFVVGDQLIGTGSGGGGAFAARIRGWFGHVDNQIAEIEGQGIDFQRLYDLYQHRRAASSLVASVRGRGTELVYRDAGFTTEDLNAQGEQPPQSRFAQPNRFDQKVAEVQKKNPDALKPINTPVASLCWEATAHLFDRNEMQMRFFRKFQRTGTFSMTDDAMGVDGLLEFNYWLKKADSLGIVMSTERVKEDLLKNGYGRVKEEELSKIVANVGGFVRVNADVDAMLEWVADEIRAMLAEAVIQNEDRFTGNLLSMQITPIDLWEAYVQVKRQLTVGVLPIKVSDKEFADRVSIPARGTTEWQEFADNKLKPFFDQYKDKEPDPTKDTPGFKIPKKFQVEFVYGDLRAATDTRKHYEKLATAQDALLPVVQALGTLGMPLPTAVPDRAHLLYESNRFRGRYRLPEDPTSAFLGGLPLADGSRYQLPLPAGPGPFNSAAGVERQTAAQHVLDAAGALLNGPLAPLGVGPALRPMPRKVARDLPQPQIVELAAALVGQGVNLGVPDLTPAFLGFISRIDYKGEHQKFTDVAAQIYDEMIEDQCRTLLDRDLKALEKDLAAYGKVYRTEYDKFKRAKARAEATNQKAPTFNPPPFTRKEDGLEIKEPIKEYVARFAKARGLLYEGMKEPRGLHELFDEVDTTPISSILRPVYVRSLPLSITAPDEEIKRTLAGQETRSSGGAKGLFEAVEVNAPSPFVSIGTKPWEYALHWKVAETDARTPTFAEAADKVVEAWKIKEGRALVEEYANKLAAQVKTDDGYRLLLDKPGYYPEKHLGKFEMSGPFSYRKSTISYMEHPPEDVVDQALEKLNSKYDTLLIANRPKTIYYLIVLKDRTEPKATDAAAVALFDNEVIIPDAQRQLKVDNRPLSQWVVSQRTAEFTKEWEKYFRDRTKYDKELAERAAETLRSFRN